MHASDLTMSSEKVRELRQYLQALPQALPLPDVTSPVNQLLNFALDPEWVEDIGEEGAVNRQIEAALHEYLPRNDAGIFFIKHRGPAIEALADVLGIWLEKYPGSTILQLWLTNAVESAKKRIIQGNGTVSLCCTSHNLIYSHCNSIYF